MAYESPFEAFNELRKNRNQYDNMLKKIKLVKLKQELSVPRLNNSEKFQLRLDTRERMNNSTTK